MDQETLQGVAFEIILSSGDARTIIHEAFGNMRNSEYDEAAKKLEDANDALVKAHQAQTGLLKEYANGETIVMEVIMVHAQDHLMTTVTLREIALEMLELYKRK